MQFGVTLRDQISNRKSLFFLPTFYPPSPPPQFMEAGRPGCRPPGMWRTSRRPLVTTGQATGGLRDASQLHCSFFFHKTIHLLQHPQYHPVKNATAFMHIPAVGRPSHNDHVSFQIVTLCKRKHTPRQLPVPSENKASNTCFSKHQFYPWEQTLPQAPSDRHRSPNTHTLPPPLLTTQNTLPKDIHR